MDPLASAQFATLSCRFHAAKSTPMKFGKTFEAQKWAPFHQVGGFRSNSRLGAFF